MSPERQKIVRIVSLTNQALIADKCVVAERFMERLRGLIGKKELASGQGMLFPRCNNVHMWFMSIPIDVVFIREERKADGRSAWKVSSVRENVPAWRPHPLMDWRASHTLELPSGSARKHAIKAGDELCIS